MRHIYGINAVNVFLQQKPELALEFFYVNKNADKIEQLLSICSDYGIACHEVKKNTLEKMTNSTQHQGSVLKVKREKQKQIKDLLAKLSSYKQARILIFDRIQDPHNLGACIRTAAAFGINDIIISEYASCKITDTVTHVSCGGSELVNVYYTKNLRSTIKKLHEHDVMVVATHISATDSYLDLKYADKTALIVSNENTGIDDKLLVHIKNQVKIELTNPLINSLNVSVAMAVIVSNPNFHRL